MVFILLPVFNRKEITLKFLDMLRRQSYRDFKLILIDDGNDGTAEAVSADMQDAIILKGNGKWWWGGSLHQGYKWLKKQRNSDDDLVLIINNDVIIKEDFLETGVTLMRENKKTLLLAAAYDAETNQLSDYGVQYDFNRNVLNKPSANDSANCFSTRGLFIALKDFITLGGFHPILLPHYASDYEFTIRAYRKGYKLKCDDRLKLWFDNKTTGVHKITNYKWKKFWKVYLSKRFVDNPIYAFNYYLLAFPFPYNVKHCLKQLKIFGRDFISVLKYNITK